MGGVAESLLSNSIQHIMTQDELKNITDSVSDKYIFCTKEVLTLDEVARYMGVSKSYLYKLTMNRQIPHYKPMGKVVYFNRVEVELWLQSNRVSTDDELSQQAYNAIEKAKRNG